jgi:phosphotransferase system  glucose/maltose/N-acetylglucosamine-specific IIC component
MGKKEYYEETIKTLRLNHTKLVQFGVLLLIGIFAFGKLYQEHTDTIILWIVIGLLIALILDIYFWIKNDKKIKRMHDQHLLHLKES